MVIGDKWHLLHFCNGYLGNRNLSVSQIGSNLFLLFVMSSRERNLKMTTVDEGPKFESLRTINWLKTRSELLLSKELAQEALSLINEFDDPLDAMS